MSDDGNIYHPPGDAARRLDVSPSGLRRYASFYEEIHGELPRDNQGRRMWSGEAVDRLEAAKALMATGKATSIKEALTALEGGMQPSVEALSVTLPKNALGLLLEEIRAMQSRLDTVERLELEVQALRRQLEQPSLFDEPPVNQTKARRSAELERMNAYLLGELERRRS